MSKKKDYKDLSIEVRITDGITGEFIACETFPLSIPKEISNDEHSKIFPLLYAEYPNSYPWTDINVDTEIISITEEG
jgi:hypothetical protein